MPRGITGPFIVSDGGMDFFAVLPPERHLLNAYRMLLEARQVALRNFPGAEGRARALAIDVVLKEVQGKVDAAATATASESEKLIVQRIKSTQVRPDPPGHSGRHVRLQDAIRSRAIKGTLAGGGVGIGEISELDKVVGRDGIPYWKAQEFGSSHLVGRKIRGFFQPGNSPAGAAPPRTHPIFEVQTGAPQMFIQNPIPERAFLREGAADAEIFRQKALGNAVAAAIAELRLIQTGNHPRLRAARRYVRGRSPRP